IFHNAYLATQGDAVIGYPEVGQADYDYTAYPASLSIDPRAFDPEVATKPVADQLRTAFSVQTRQGYKFLNNIHIQGDEKNKLTFLDLDIVRAYVTGHDEKGEQVDVLTEQLETELKRIYALAKGVDVSLIDENSEEEGDNVQYKTLAIKINGVINL